MTDTITPAFSKVRTILDLKLAPDALDQGPFVIAHRNHLPPPENPLSWLEEKVVIRPTAGPETDSIFVLRVSGVFDYSADYASIWFLKTIDEAVEVFERFGCGQKRAFIARAGMLKP